LNHLSIALMRWCHREIALPRIVETADHCEVLLGGAQFSLGALISELCDRGFELGNQPRAFRSIYSDTPVAILQKDCREVLRALWPTAGITGFAFLELRPLFGGLP
jgi:hypothetical protein